ncbi:MAG: hypothetical protein JOZ73_11920 [Solirubrobacterales bacterium]|nr:hypothetical protein [Solirubrobacterales bacterium]
MIFDRAYVASLLRYGIASRKDAEEDAMEALTRLIDMYHDMRDERDAMRALLNAALAENEALRSVIRPSRQGVSQ